MTDPEDWNIRIDANSDRTRSLHFSPNFSYRVSGLDRGQEVRTGLNISYRPVPNWRLSLEPSFSKSRDAAQYVTRSGALEFLPTFGDRYLFGNLERTSVSMDTRLNVSFTPDMSLQLYAQPLLSSGDYLGYRQLAASESFDFIDYTEGTPIEVDGVVTGCLGGTTCVLNDVRHFDFDGDGGSDHATSDRDFNIRSLRGNAVFRWEYRPGSELFLVWQHSRRDRFNDGNFDFNRDFSGLFSAPAENVFIIKMSHYLSF